MTTPPPKYRFAEGGELVRIPEPCPACHGNGIIRWTDPDDRPPASSQDWFAWLASAESIEDTCIHCEGTGTAT